MNLKVMFPQPLRGILRDSFSWVVLTTAVVLLGIAVSEEWLSVGSLNRDQLVAKKLIFFAGLLTVVIVRFSYSLLYRASYRYEIVRGRLRIVRGVVVKEEASLPLMPLTEIYIRRSWLDLVFGLANLHVAVALERAARIGEIRGLSSRDARKMRDFILDLVEAPAPVTRVTPASVPSAATLPVLSLH